MAVPLSAGRGRPGDLERGLTAGAIDLIPTIETATGLEVAKEIARASPRVRRLVFGAGDFRLDLGLSSTQEETELISYRNALVLASRAARLQAPLDAPWIDLKDPEGMRGSTARAKALGFQGKLCIHPDQVTVVNEVFTPGDKEVERAKRIVEAFANAERGGSASFQLDGQFVDYAIVRRAQQVLELAERIAMHRRGGGE